MSGAHEQGPRVGTLLWEEAGSGVVHLVMDTRAHDGRVDLPLMAAFEAVADRITEQASHISGVVIRSATPAWFGCTDMAVVAASGEGGATDLAAAYARFALALRRIEMTAPTVALISGSALGLGLEIALACHHRICTDNPQLRLGLPDIGVGLLPAAGGMARTARMLGFQDALNKLLLPGATFDPAAALKLGLVDALVPDTVGGLAAAEHWLASHAGARQPWDSKGWQMPGGAPSSPSRYFTLHALPALLRQQFACPHYPAPLQLLSAVVDGSIAGDFRATLMVEHRHVLKVLRHPSTTQLLHALHRDAQRLPDPWQPQQGADALQTRLAHPWILDAGGGAAGAPGALEFARRIGRSLADAARAMLEEGVPLSSVSQASRQAGFGVDLLVLAQSLGVSLPGHGTPAPEPARDPAAISLDALQSRLLEAGARAAHAGVQEGILPDPSLGNIVSILGAGYPPWTGGALRYAGQSPQR